MTCGSRDGCDTKFYGALLFKCHKRATHSDKLQRPYTRTRALRIRLRIIYLMSSVSRDRDRNAPVATTLQRRVYRNYLFAVILYFLRPPDALSPPSVSLNCNNQLLPESLVLRRAHAVVCRGGRSRLLRNLRRVVVMPREILGCFGLRFDCN